MSPWVKNSVKISNQDYHICQANLLITVIVIKGFRSSRLKNVRDPFTGLREDPLNKTTLEAKSIIKPSKKITVIISMV